jgi:hypothetical protein
VNVDAFLQALECVWPSVSAPQVAAAWEKPSALSNLTVGALTAHLAYVVDTVDSHLDRPLPEGAEPIDVVAYYLGTLHGEEDSASVRNATASRDAERAQPGPVAVLAVFDQARERLRRRLPQESPERLMRVPIARCMRLDEFLVTRVLDQPSPAFPKECGNAIIALLVEMSRRRHGDTAVIRALTRSERDTIEALRVF